MKRQLMIAAAASVVVTLVFTMILIKPKMSAVAETRSQVAAAEQEEQALRTRLKRLEEAKQNAPRFLARIERVTRLLPTDPDLPGFIRIVQKAAQRARVELASIAPSPPSALAGATGVETIGVTLNFTGRFRDVQSFLARLEGLERAVEVRSVSLTPQQGAKSGQTTLQATVAMRMFVAAENASVAGARPRTVTVQPQSEVTP